MHLTDAVLDQYDYDTDTLLCESVHNYDRDSLRRIYQYGKTINKFGFRLMAHQNRVAKDGEAFLKHLGYSKTACKNYRAAMVFHDIGKIQAIYEPEIWTLPHRPTKEQKRLHKKHTRFGGQMWANFANSVDGLMDHPHFKVRHALTLYHHERIDAKGPENIKADDLPVFVKVSCITDAYDGDRIYRPHQPKRRTPKEALDRMQCKSGPDRKYDGAFDLDLLKKYVEFKTEELGLNQ